MKFTNPRDLTIGLILSATLIVNTSSGMIGAVPPNQDSMMRGAGKLGEASSIETATAARRKKIDKESKLKSELQEKYKRAFNQLLEDCSNWRQNPGSPKPIDTTCEDLTQKMRIANINTKKQDALVDELEGITIINSSEHRRRLLLPTDAETLKRNQARIDNETKLARAFDQEFNNTLDPILGNCRKRMDEDPARPKPSDTVCKDLTEKVRTAGSKLIDQAELLEKLKDELPLAARKDQMPQCDGFYLPSGTFISLPDCPLSQP